MDMFKTKKVLLYIFIVIQIFNIPAFSVEDVKLPSAQYVTGITFNDILDKAKNHSYDLKLADFNTLISKTGIKAARSEYFPKLNASIGTEYTKNFRDARESTVMSIGEAFINPYTRFQSVMGIALNYNLFDFGVRRGNLNAAKEDVSIKELEEQEKWQELRLNLVDTYTKILLAKKQLSYYNNILALQQKNLEFKTRLFEAQEISALELNDANVETETIKNRIADLNSMLSESLEWLSFYTGETYNIKDFTIEDIKKPDFDVTAFHDYTKSLTWQIREKYIKKKEYELKVAQRMNYPKVNLYSKYYWYGSDPNNFGDSIKDISQSNFSIGGSVNWLAFDGMKNRANIQKTSLELQQLHVERDKAVAQLMTRLATMRSNLIYVNEQSNSSEKIIKELKTKEKSVHRLLAKGLATPIEENEVKIQILNHQIEQVKNTTTATALIKGIEILTEY